MIKKITSLSVVLVFLAGCSILSGRVREDLNDEAPRGPTVGGAWTEGSLLEREESSYGTIGHMDRSPAGEYGAENAQESWVSAEQAEASRRDYMRGRNGGEEGEDVAMSNTPNMPPQSKRFYKGRATKKDFVDQTPNEGSLWGADGQTNFYFSKNKTRSMGDLVTIEAESELVRDVGAEIARGLTPKEKEAEIEAAQERNRKQALGIPDDSVTSSAAAPAKPSAPPATAAKGKDKKSAEPAEEPEIKTATAADIDVTKSMGFKVGDTVMGEIVERYPNGNYKLRGAKRIPYRGGYRFVTLTAVARGQDMTEEDTIKSGKLYEYRLESLR